MVMFFLQVFLHAMSFKEAPEDIFSFSRVFNYLTSVRGEVLQLWRQLGRSARLGTTG
jgi:hypothetical protein